jgi:hypothetical protein
MSDQPEKVGFEAFFETQEFKQGVNKFVDGISLARKESDSFIDDIVNLDRQLGKLAGSLAGAAIGASAGMPGVGAAIGDIIGSQGLSGILFAPLKPFIAGLKLVFDPVIKALKLIGQVGKAAFDIVGKAIGTAIGTAMKVAGAFALVLTGTVIGALVMVGNRARNIFRDIFGSIDELIENTKELQTMEVGINALVRAALVLEGSFDKATDAIAAAVPIAEDLNNILVEMSLTSPYALPDIYELFRTNAAFGFTIEASLELTKAMLELGAATGFSSSVLERIGRNFAQIAKNGRIFQRDVYEMANAGIDLAAVLRQELGMSIAEVNEAMVRGEVSVDDLKNALVNFAETTYGGSTEALSQTLVGLENRLRTIGMLITSDFMRPILERAVPAIMVLVQALAAIVRSGVFEVIGKHFAQMGKMIVGDVEWTVESVAEGIMQFMLWLARQSNVMLEYGFGMMEAWGTGMLEGARRAITAVVRFISDAISSLFSTHSPPAILPMIDVWGAETIEAWLEGMTHADFSILNDLIDTVSNILQNIGFEEPSIQGVLQRMTKAVSGGGVGAILGIVSEFAGPFSGQMGDVIRAYRELAKENEVLEQIMRRVANAENILAGEMEILEEKTRAVERAQKSLEDAMQFYEDSDTAVQRLVREYNELLRAGANDKVLRAKQDEIDAMMDQRTEAANLIEEAEAQIDVAEDARDAQKDIADEKRDLLDAIKEEEQAQKDVIETYKEQLDTEKAVLDMMIKLTKQIEEATDAVGEMASGIGEIASEMEGMVAGVGDIGSFSFGFDTSDLEHRLRVLKGRIEWELQQFRLRFFAKVNEIVEQLSEPFEGLQTEVGELVTLIGNITGISEDVTNSWELFKLKVKLVWQNAKLVFKWLALIKTWVSTPWNLIAIANLATEIHDLEGEIGNTKDSIDTLEDKINTQTNSVFPELGTALVNVKDDFGIVEDGVDDLDDAVGDLETQTGETKSVWATAWQNMKTKLEENQSPILAAIEPIESVFNNIDTALSNIITSIGNMITEFAKVTIPWWFQEKSPSPFEKALIHVGERMDWLSNKKLRGLQNEMNSFSGIDSIINFRPTPTSVVSPSAISNHSVTNNINMGGNVVRDDMDLALIQNNLTRQLRQASYGT